MYTTKNDNNDNDNSDNYNNNYSKIDGNTIMYWSKYR